MTGRLILTPLQRYSLYILQLQPTGFAEKVMQIISWSVIKQVRKPATDVYSQQFGLILRNINHFRLFKAKSIFVHINSFI